MNLTTNTSVKISKFVRNSLRTQRTAEARASGAERRAALALSVHLITGGVGKGVRNSVRKYCREGVRKYVREYVRKCKNATIPKNTQNTKFTKIRIMDFIYNTKIKFEFCFLKNFTKVRKYVGILGVFCRINYYFEYRIRILCI